MQHVKNKKSRCHWAGCHAALDSKADLLQHMLTDHGVPVIDDFLEAAEYCFECAEYFLSAQDWEAHCERHLSDLDLFCGFITRRNVYLFARRCPFCLGNDQLAASERCRDFTERTTFYKHLKEHLDDPVLTWPLRCPHPLCRIDLSSRDSCEAHFNTSHHLARYRRANVRWRAAQDYSAKDISDEEQDPPLSSGTDHHGIRSSDREDRPFSTGEVSCNTSSYGSLLRSGDVSSAPGGPVDTTIEERADMDGIADAYTHEDCAISAQCLDSDNAASQSARIDPELLQWEAHHAVASHPEADRVQPTEVNLDCAESATKLLGLRPELEAVLPTVCIEDSDNPMTDPLAVDDQGPPSNGKRARAGGKILCEICAEAFRTSRNMASHMIATHQTSPYKCHLPAMSDPGMTCDRIFRDNTRLRDHMASHSSNARFRCKYAGCPHSYHTESKLRQHIRQVHRGRIYQCVVKEGNRYCQYYTNDERKFYKHKHMRRPGTDRMT